MGACRRRAAQSVRRAALAAAGVGAEDATICADLMVASSLRGIDSHGVVALLPMFSEHAKAGVGADGTAPAVVEQQGAACVVEGRRAGGARTASSRWRRRRSGPVGSAPVLPSPARSGTSARSGGVSSPPPSGPDRSGGLQRDGVRRPARGTRGTARDEPDRLRVSERARAAHRGHADEHLPHGRLWCRGRRGAAARRRRRPGRQAGHGLRQARERRLGGGRLHAGRRRQRLRSRARRRSPDCRTGRHAHRPRDRLGDRAAEPGRLLPRARPRRVRPGGALLRRSGAAERAGARDDAGRSGLPVRLPGERASADAAWAGRTACRWRRAPGSGWSGASRARRRAAAGPAALARDRRLPHPPLGAGAPRASVHPRGARAGRLGARPDARPGSPPAGTAAADRVCVFAFRAPRIGVRVPNDYVAEYVATDPERLYGYASVDPTESGAVAELERAVLELGLRGLKLVPTYGG